VISYDVLYASLVILAGILLPVLFGISMAALLSWVRDDVKVTPLMNKHGWAYALERFTELLDLPCNWDGEDAKPPSLAAAAAAKTIAYALRAHNVVGPDRIVPTLNGGIQMEWFTEEGYVEVEILSDGLHTEWMIETCDGEYVHFPSGTITDSSDEQQADKGGEVKS